MVRFALLAGLLWVGPGAYAADRLVVPPGAGDNNQVRYELTIPNEKLVLDQMLSVKLVLRARDGGSVDGASVGISGGMPTHGHGLPTAPAVTSTKAGGIYVIEGLRFNMPGLWELKLQVDAEGISDTITVEIQL